jgi:hypothetical protein
LNVHLDIEIKAICHKHFLFGDIQAKLKIVCNPEVPAADLNKNILTYIRACLQSAEYADMLCLMWKQKLYIKQGACLLRTYFPFLSTVLGISDIAFIS